MFRMRTFLKIGDTVINTLAIKRIVTTPEKHTIEFISSATNGFWVYGSGSVSTNTDDMIIYSDKTPLTYEYLTKWIKTVVIA